MRFAIAETKTGRSLPHNGRKLARASPLLGNTIRLQVKLYVNPGRSATGGSTSKNNCTALVRTEYPPSSKIPYGKCQFVHSFFDACRLIQVISGVWHVRINVL